MQKKRKLSSNSACSRDSKGAMLLIEQPKVCLAPPVLIWERPPSKYNPIIIIDDIPSKKTL